MARMKPLPASLAAIAALFAPIAPSAARQTAPADRVAIESGGSAYARLARLALDAPVVIDATIRSASRIRPAEATGLAPGHVRFYVTADVGALIRANGPLPARIGYLVDVPFDPRGRAPLSRHKAARWIPSAIASPAPPSPPRRPRRNSSSASATCAGTSCFSGPSTS